MKKFIASMTVLLAFGLTQAPIVFADGVVQNSEAQKEARTVKKYPPYPDVWDWITPFPSRTSYRFQAELLPDGDVQLSYQLKSKSPKPTEDVIPRGEEYSFLFFDKQSLSPLKDFPARHNKWRVRLPSGKIILNPGSGGGGNCFHLFDRVFTVHDREANELAHKVLFYVLDHPETFVPSGMCEGMPYDDPPFSYRMVTMLGDLIPLEDNTFLVVDFEHGVVIRFDEQWQSKSPLLNHRIFIMDKQEFNAFIRNRKYEKSEAEGYGIRWQVVDEDLYQYLITTKGRR